jgi:hypothetical protein
MVVDLISLWPVGTTKQKENAGFLINPLPGGGKKIW